MSEGKKKIGFKQKKDLMVYSLKQVNNFLLNLNTTKKSITLFKWFK